MNTAKKLTGLAIATAAAGMFATAVPTIAAAGESSVQCFGANACKGKTSCKSASNACKGQNSCKGQGFVSISAEACDQIGGETKG
ncbi:MAG: hypothetical protein U9Q71_10705 [Pseudomonadota bacterium]|nr:hypothetical protein [Pseudomonadota bacterium]